MFYKDVLICDQEVRFETHEDYKKILEAEEEEKTDVSTEAHYDAVLPETYNVTVKFRVTPAQVIAQVYSNRISIRDIKIDIGSKFGVEAEILTLTQNNKDICDECLLVDTEKDDYGIHEFSLNVIGDSSDSSDGYNIPLLDLDNYYKKQRLPDFITVHIDSEDTEDCQPKNIVVEIQNKAIIKPFLCGFKNKQTGIKYYDAFTQTGPHFDEWKYRRYRSRDTQTYELKQKIMNTSHDQTAQCFLDDLNVLFVSEARDVVIIPGKYQTYEQVQRKENKLAKIKLIQRNWRRFLIMRFMKNAAAEYRRLVANRIVEEEKFNEERVKRMEQEQRVKQFPHTKDDFDMLYGEVEKWKVAELKRISQMYEGAARIAEVNILLNEEIEMLNRIDRQRTLVHRAMEDLREEQMLKKLGSPIKWIGYKDTLIHLDLLRTQRARYLHEIYKEIRKPTPKDERLKLISKIKIILDTERDFPEYLELEDLFEREKNLLLYTNYCDVDVLRKRQNILFLALIKYNKDSPPKKVMKHLCEVCKGVKPVDDFAVRTRQNIVNTCNNCHYMKVTSSENIIYKAILRAIQRDERKKNCSASFAFVIQLDDIRYLVDKIWHGHSVLSKNEDLSNLRLPRWIISEDWSPWNCVCLTDIEARNHYRIGDLEKVYDRHFILEVEHRLKLGRSVFRTLGAVATEFTESGQWWNVGMNKQRINNIPKMLKIMNCDKQKTKIGTKKKC